MRLLMLLVAAWDASDLATITADELVCVCVCV